ncbi:class I SAM-dependent methyltransferase [Candidatus Auribacterota bacterium]
MIETFPKDSSFITRDLRQKRWAIPYSYDALNGRVENLILNQRFAIQNKKILDLGCHFGTFAYASLIHGAKFVQGIDSEVTLIKQAKDLFKEHHLEQKKYSFLKAELTTFLEKQNKNTFDTILCLGIFYYLNDLVQTLRLMKKVAKKYIVLDTFTAYYGATVAKERKKIADYMKDESFELPLIIYPLTQAKKTDYTLTHHFKRKNKKSLSILSLPTIPALENFFRLLDLEATLLSWKKYVVNNYSWKDFMGQEIKRKSHWADVYHTKIRVSYLLKV